MTKLEEINQILDQYQLRAKKRFGQNFLIDELALEAIAGSGELVDDDIVVEIGPGTGFLTEKLIGIAKRVVAVEYDADMVRVLHDRFRGTKNLEVVHADALNFRIKDSGLKAMQYKVIANIPYYITYPLIKHFLQSGIPPKQMVFLVQKEVAQKVCGLTGKSLITIETQLFGRPEIVQIVPSKSFFPPPKVDSAILKIEVFDKPFVPFDQLDSFLRVVKFGFSQKRKKLSNSLSAGIHLKPAELRPYLIEAKINPDGRAEDLEIDDWRRLQEVLATSGFLA